MRWEADKVISRVPVRSEPEKGNLFPGHVNHGTDHSREIQQETEEASHSENAPEPPLNKATRYHTMEKNSGDFNCCLVKQPDIKNITYPPIFSPGPKDASGSVIERGSLVCSLLN